MVIIGYRDFYESPPRFGFHTVASIQRRRRNHVVKESGANLKGQAPGRHHDPGATARAGLSAGPPPSPAYNRATVTVTVGLGRQT